MMAFVHGGAVGGSVGIARVSRCGRSAGSRVASGRTGARSLRMAAQETMSGRKTFDVAKPVGAILEELESGNVFVAELTDGGNAGKAGIAKGDVIVAVDGAKVLDKGLEVVMDAIRSSDADAVKLQVERTVVVPGQTAMDANVKERLRKEISAPYRQNWLGGVVVFVLALIVLARFAGIR